MTIKQENKETKTASQVAFDAITPERWAELDKMMSDYEKHCEKINSVPLNAVSEKYIRARYPLAMLYTRADLQDYAASYFETALTEKEIRHVSDAFFDQYPDEILNTLIDIIERLIKRRRPLASAEK
jgi:hypothetical protein